MPESDCSKYPDKVLYLSQAVAENACVLHTLASKDGKCTTIEAYSCGDHFHIGHKKTKNGDYCKSELGGGMAKWPWWETKKKTRKMTPAERRRKKRQAAASYQEHAPRPDEGDET